MKKQIKNVIMLAAVVGSLSLQSCRETSEDKVAPPMQNEMHEEDMDHNMDGDDTMMDDQDMDTTSAKFKDDKTAEVYNHYIAIKSALVKTDAPMAQGHAKMMIGSIENTEANAELVRAARDISTSNDVNKQREAFSQLTATMESLLNGAIESGEIYKQYCPMAFEGKGDSWFSNSKEIRNPYYGDKMLKCGRIEATIK
ncbi:DUF3347 domain-containing protein [Gillisia sp. Q332]|uniref:DUF3347 domain-containing protein n=1 Tax=Gillisia xinjiangensis TaxID=3384765 RepID=UPI00391C2FC8